MGYSLIMKMEPAIGGSKILADYFGVSIEYFLE